MSFPEAASAEDVIDQPARAQRDGIPGAGRHSPWQPARPAPAALALPPHAPRACSALRARRHPPRAAPRRVARVMGPLLVAERSCAVIWVWAPGAMAAAGPLR